MNIKRTIAKLDIKDGEVLLLRGSWDQQALSDIFRCFNDNNLKNVVIICLPEGRSLEKMDEKGMNLAGWYKKEA